MTKQRKINSTYAIVMVIGLAFMLLFGYLVKPFSTVTVTGVKMLGVLIGLIIITCFNGDLLSGSLMALLATLFHGYYDISGLLSEWLGSVFTVQLVFCGALCLALRDSGAMNVLAKKLLSMKRFVKCFFELLTQIIVKVRKRKVQRVCVLHFQLAGSGGCFFLMKLYH